MIQNLLPLAGILVAINLPEANAAAPLAEAQWIAPPEDRSATDALPLYRKEFSVSV